MKLSDVQVDAAKVEEGDWIGEKYGTPIPDMGDLCLRVRGVNNADWRKLQGRLIDGIPRKERYGGRVSPEAQDGITRVCLRDAALLDWENVEGDGVIGDLGKLVPYDKKTADKLLGDPIYLRFRDAVLWAATIVGEQKKKDEATVAKN